MNVGFALPAVASDEKQVIGWVEKVQLLPGKITVHAKIDTGADHSSLNVDELTEFIRHGERWVRFSVPSQLTDEITIERAVYRYARVKQKGAAPQKRPVVLLGVCLAGISNPDVEVNLVNRKNFTYPMLIGRSFLTGHFIVDSSVTFTRRIVLPLVSIS